MGGGKNLDNKARTLGMMIFFFNAKENSRDEAHSHATYGTNKSKPRQHWFLPENRNDARVRRLDGPVPESLSMDIKCQCL
jgi:hypothetical protein